MSFFATLLSPFTFFLSQDPTVATAQALLIVLGLVVLFLLLFTVRDILLRTRSFGYQFISIVLVALLPGIGFLIYLLIRPARTIKQRETEAMLRALMVEEFGETEETKESNESKETKEEEKEEQKKDDHDHENHAHHSHHHHS